VRRALAPTERADDERPDDPVVSFEGEGEGEDVLDPEEVGFERGTSVDGPLGVGEDLVGIKVAVGPFVLTLVLILVFAPVLVLLRDGGTPEDGGRHFGVLEESRKH